MKRILGATALAVVILALLPMGAGASIVYEKGTGKVYSMHNDGTASRLLATWGFYPVISENSQTVVYESDGDLFKISPDGGPRTKLGGGPKICADCIWDVSPDGRYVWMLTLGNEDAAAGNLSVVATDGVTPLVPLAVGAFAVDFSPDSSRIVFSRDIPATGNYGTAVLSVTGGTPVEIGSLGTQAPAWTSAGIVATAPCKRGSTYFTQLILFDQSGKPIRVLREKKYKAVKDFVAGRKTEFAFAHAGANVVTTVNDNPKYGGEPGVIRLVGTTTGRVKATRRVSDIDSFAVSSSGSTLIFTDISSGRLTSINTKTGKRKVLVRAHAHGGQIN